MILEFKKIFFDILKIILVILPVLISVAYITLVERKIIASIQKREGPNFVGFFGMLQPIADGLKLLLKETLYPSHSIKLSFIFAPMFIFFINLLGWLIIPINEGVVIADLNIGILYLFALSSFSVYGLLIAGWCSNSKYPFLGGLRAAAQMISYDVSLGLILLSIVVTSNSMNLTQIVLNQEPIWFIVPHFPGFCLFFISVLAETSRTPFDLPEAESELVSGYNTEYSSMMFALFFLGEYVSILLMSSLISILFLGGWLSFYPLNLLPAMFIFAIKTVLIVIVLIYIRAALPRYRYDQLMSLGWKIFLPLSLSWFLFSFCILVSFNIN